MLITILLYIIQISGAKRLNLYYEEKNSCLIDKNLRNRDILYDKKIIQLMFDNIWDILINNPQFDEAFIDDEFVPRKHIFNNNNEVKSAVFQKIMTYLSSSYKDNKEHENRFSNISDIFFVDNMAEEVYKIIEMLYLCDEWGEYIQSENKIKFYDHITELIRKSFIFKKSIKLGRAPRIKLKNCIDQKFLDDSKCANKFERHISISENTVEPNTINKQDPWSSDEPDISKSITSFENNYDSDINNKYDNNIEDEVKEVESTNNETLDEIDSKLLNDSIEVTQEYNPTKALSSTEHPNYINHFSIVSSPYDTYEYKNIINQNNTSNTKIFHENVLFGIFIGGSIFLIFIIFVLIYCIIKGTKRSFTLEVDKNDIEMDDLSNSKNKSDSKHKSKKTTVVEIDEVQSFTPNNEN